MLRGLQTIFQQAEYDMQKAQAVSGGASCQVQLASALALANWDWHKGK